MKCVAIDELLEFLADSLSPKVIIVGGVEFERMLDVPGDLDSKFTFRFDGSLGGFA